MDKRPLDSHIAKSPQLVTFDAILPAAMAARAEESGVKRISTDPLTLFVLSILAGAFIAFGAVFATTVSAGTMVIAPVGDGVRRQFCRGVHDCGVDVLYDTVHLWRRLGRIGGLNDSQCEEFAGVHSGG